MRVNLHMLKEDIANYIKGEHLTSDPWIINCERPMICDIFPENISDNIIYVIPADRLPDRPHFKGQLSAICIGRPPERWLSASCDLLWTGEGVKMTAICNELYEAICRYDDWADSLQEMLDEHRPLRDMVQYSHRMIKNPIYLQGPTFRVLIHSIPAGCRETPLFPKYREKYFYESSESGNDVLPAEDINLLISDREYIEAEDMVEPSIYSGGFFGFRSLFYNIRIQGITVARICIDEVITPVTSRDFALVRILGHYLGKGIGKDHMYEFNRYADMDTILRLMLANRPVSQEKTGDLLRSIGWERYSTYCCMIMKLQTKENSSDALEPLALYVGKMLRDECYTVSGEMIVFVCNLSVLNREADDLLNELLPTLRDNLLTAATSSTFKDFTKLYYFYRQAVEAYEIGTRKYPMRWYFHYEDFRMDSIVDSILTNTIPDAIIPDGLRRLMEYDRSRNTQYTELLRIYLDHDRNIADTSCTAYIHRNTCLYRLQKITEILKMDLDDAVERLEIQIAFKVMDADNNKSKISALKDSK